MSKVDALRMITLHPVASPPVERGVSGKHIYPGMIDPLTNLGIYEFGAVGQAADVSETGTPCRR